LQAAIAVCHARAREASDTDWAQIASLYAALYRLIPSSVIEMKRACAVGIAEGPAAGLEVVDRLIDEPSLKNYHHLPAVRGDLLVKLGRLEEAGPESERGAAVAKHS